LSYNPADPSLNTASAGAGIRNWMGAPGAWVADLLLQTLGVGGAVFGLIPLIWGWRVLTRRPVGGLALRMAAGIVAALLLSAAFARLPAGGWIVHPYLGGSGGTLLLGWFSDLIALVAPGWAYALAAALSAGFGFCAFLFAASVSTDEMREATWRGADLAAYVVRQGVYGFGRVRSWVAAYGLGSAREEDEDDEAPAPSARLRARRVPAVSDEESGEEEDSDLSAPRRAASDGGPSSSSSSIKVVTPPSSRSKKSAASPQQGKFPLSESGEWILPAVDLLQEPPVQEWDTHLDESGLRRNAEMLQTVLGDFNVRGEIETIHPGPVVTLYELEPAPGTKSSRVISLSDDIARSMSAVSVRCAVVPGRSVIGIELPNRKRQTVYMREILVSRDYEKTQARLPLVLGKDIGGAAVIADLSRMPHLLVAGTTGSGKSVAINTMILSLLYALPPEKCRFIMIDPKMLELSVYDGIPHLLSPVVTEPGKAVVALKWAVREMEDRYRAMSKLGVRNIDGYNARLKEARRKGEVLMRKVQTGFDPDTGKPVYEEQPLDLTELPYIVIIVDEFADLMLVAGKDVESAVQRLAQMARAAGIHLIMATQRPSVDVITGVIKANFPTRISFQVTSKIDSRTILGESGAEQLLGMGDM
ncbi:MAG TPA: DNA translocase FtsK 4TM domain-containing protein, partial [Alphaproteobacteria bacterium]|nr:DNA translocase FtsK 4TM domain-containing protein [Alphaproteobacteria bacterium]